MKSVCAILAGVTIVSLGVSVTQAGTLAATDPSSASSECCFGDVSAPFTPSYVEGPSAIRIGDDYVVYVDCYTKGHYGAVRSRNLKDWEDVTSQLTFPKGTRHGTVLRVPRSVVDELSESKECTGSQITSAACQLVLAFLLPVGFVRAKPPDMRIRKKLIATGWDHADSQRLLANLAEMEKRPFDGVVKRWLEGD